MSELQCTHYHLLYGLLKERGDDYWQTKTFTSKELAAMMYDLYQPTITQRCLYTSLRQNVFNIVKVTGMVRANHEPGDRNSTERYRIEDLAKLYRFLLGRAEEAMRWVVFTVKYIPASIVEVCAPILSARAGRRAERGPQPKDQATSAQNRPRKRQRRDSTSSDASTSASEPDSDYPESGVEDDPAEDYSDSDDQEEHEEDPILAEFADFATDPSSTLDLVMAPCFPTDLHTLPDIDTVLCW
jgi:hypothetical protein